MNINELQKVDKRTIKIWNIGDTIKFLIFTAFIVVVQYILKDYKFVQKLCLVGYFANVGLYIQNIFFNYLLFKNKLYKITEENICIYKKGIINEEIRIPIFRVQHMNISQTYISRWFELYELTVYTAGDCNTIGFISKEAADDIMQQVQQFLRGKEDMNAPKIENA
ncbi:MULTISPECIES: PH domain-containing protein [unclassified Bacillus cereus group]|uniref:PH domain-containing protein n=1 Tax=unclassified Bacillus cereus group TaxID=2750818 RepID=UPI001F59FAF0|nr:MULTISPECIES: PH domain-containing protein [unclassified Bacillus cereus group]